MCRDFGNLGVLYHGPKSARCIRWYNFLSLLAMHLHVFFMICDFMRVRSFKRSRKWRLRSRTLRHGQFAGIEMFCNKLMVLHAEFLQSNSLSMPVPGRPCHTIDPSKVAYYRLKLAIEALREEAYL
ncbi:unnamed protein product [Prunus brigantina]